MARPLAALAAGLTLIVIAASVRATEQDHRLLNWYPDKDGKTQPLKSSDEWLRRRAAILAAMQKVMGALPDRTRLPPLEIHTRESVTREKYRRDTITFNNLYDERVTANLYIPHVPVKERRGAILALHQTNPAAKANTDDTEKNSRNFGYATELARLGYIVIAPDYPSFGEQKDYNFKISKYASGTMKAISDNMRCIDLLLSRGDVDPERIAAIGHSLGGHNTLFTAAFDTRIQIAVSSCGWTPFHQYNGGKNLDAWAQDRYMPRVRDVYHARTDEMPFDFAEVIGAIAPRAVFVNAPLHDSNFDVEGVMLAASQIRPLFDLLGAKDKFVVEDPDCEHDFPPRFDKKRTDL